MRYPDYVKKFRPKGTIVKRVNDTYYAYYATSKRVPDKKYPVQVIRGLAGRIDESGFHKLSKAFVDTGHVVIRECGFTNFLLNLDDEPGTTIYSAAEMVEKFRVGIPNQVTAISRICEYDLKELEPLKYICSVTMGKRRFESELTKSQRELLERIGIREDDIR